MKQKTCEACEAKFRGAGKYCEPCAEFMNDRAIEEESSVDGFEEFELTDDFDDGAFGEGRLG